MPRRILMQAHVVLTGLAILLGLAGANPGATLAADQEPRAAHKEFVPPRDTPHPQGNLYSKEKAALGKKLFFDPLLSASQIVSCATCHNPDLSWSDGLARSVGDKMRALGRRSPTILNLAWANSFFWDGRAESLEQQALDALRSPDVMDMPPDALVARVRKNPDYVQEFAAAFPSDGLTAESIAMALATFERTLVSGEAAFDRWNRGDTKAMSESAQRGFQLFDNKAGCSGCHSGWRFTDDSFYDIGLPDADLGRGKFVGNVDALRHAFKTPTLRDVASRGPFMHDGSLTTLADVIDHYDKGGISRPSHTSAIKPLRLTRQEKEDLLNFLKALSSDKPGDGKSRATASTADDTLVPLP